MRPVTLFISTDLASFGKYATALASIVRRTNRLVWAKCYIHDSLPESFEIKNLRVDFIAGDQLRSLGASGKVPQRLGDYLRVIDEAEEWDRCLVINNDMACFSDLGEYFDEDFEGNLLMSVLEVEADTLGWRMEGMGGLPPDLQHTAHFTSFRMGPMLNLAQMRIEGTSKRVLEVHEALRLEIEQMILMASIGDRVKAAHPKWNQVPEWNFRDGTDGSWKVLDRKIEGIVRWSERMKPWDYNSKAWRADIWEGERTNWETLRSGNWSKPEMWDLSGAPASEIKQWARRGWQMKVLKRDAPPPPVAKDVLLSEEAAMLRAEAWQKQQETNWQELVLCPDVVEIDESQGEVEGSPEVVFFRDIEQLEKSPVKPRYIGLRSGVCEDTGGKLASLGFGWQRCREKENQSGAVAEGVDYVEGAWKGTIPEDAEIVAWNGSELSLCAK